MATATEYICDQCSLRFPYPLEFRLEKAFVEGRAVTGYEPFDNSLYGPWDLCSLECLENWTIGRTP